tara:strand:- start:500 stop:835 length:336 start_codon:yes stop_codon:yes gene_type:complete
MSRGRPKDREDIIKTKYIRTYDNAIWYYDLDKFPNGPYRVDNLDPTYDKLEKLFEKVERLQKPEYHENGRKKRITKIDKQKMEFAEAAYWKEHYKFYPEDRPKKRGRKPKQ